MTNPAFIPQIAGGQSANMFPGYAAAFYSSPYGTAGAAASAWPPPTATAAAMAKLDATVSLPTTSTAAVPKLEESKSGALDVGSEYQPNCYVTGLYGAPPQGLPKSGKYNLYNFLFYAALS